MKRNNKQVEKGKRYTSQPRSNLIKSIYAAQDITSNLDNKYKNKQ